MAIFILKLHGQIQCCWLCFLKEFGQCVIRICVTFTWQKIKLIPYSLIKYIYIFQTIASMWFLGDFVTGKVGCVLTVTNVFTIWNERIVPEVKNGEQWAEYAVRFRKQEAGFCFLLIIALDVFFCYSKRVLHLAVAQ